MSRVIDETELHAWYYIQSRHYTTALWRIATNEILLRDAQFAAEDTVLRLQQQRRRSGEWRPIARPRVVKGSAESITARRDPSSTPVWAYGTRADGDPIRLGDPILGSIRGYWRAHFAHCRRRLSRSHRARPRSTNRCITKYEASLG